MWPLTGRLLDLGGIVIAVLFAAAVLATVIGNLFMGGVYKSKRFSSKK